MNIVLDYTLTFGEWAEAFQASNRSIAKHRRTLPFLIITIALVSSLLVLLSNRRGIRLLSSVLWPIVPALLIAIIFWLVLRRRVRELAHVEWNTNPTLRGRCSVTLSDSTIAITQELRQATWQWPAFVKFDESANLLLLYVSQRSFLPIPKRAFAGANLEEFVDFLMKTLPPAHPGPAGFKVIPKAVSPTPVHIQPLESRDFM